MESKGDGKGADNVIRLPRDWVGPLEELVPVGARARARAAERTPDETARASDDSDDIESVPAADDFWTASAGAVHHAIQGPTPPAATADVSAQAPVTGSRRPRPSLRPRVAIAVAGALLAAGLVLLIVFMASPGSREPTAPAARGESLPHFDALGSAVSTGVADVGKDVHHATLIAHMNALARADRRRSHLVASRSRKLTHAYTSVLRRQRAAASAAAARPETRSRPTQGSQTATTDTPIAEPAVASPATSSSSGPSESTGSTSSNGSTSSGGSAPGDGSTSSSSSASSGGSASGDKSPPPSQPAGPTGVGGATGCNPQCS